MSDALSRSLEITKHVVETDRGVVAAQHRQAAEAGAEVLAAGGDAVDAAVACSFVCGVLEPWMSGPAGGGGAMHWRAGTGTAHALNFGMSAPSGLRLADFPLSGEGVAADLFPWDRVVEDRNVQGARAVAVPGVVAGLDAAHARWGRMPWADLLQPAIADARRGMEVDWYAALIIASAARDLARDPDAAAQFLQDGRFPRSFSWTAQGNDRIDQSRMADSLDILARDGAAALHGGDLGAALAADVAAKGGYLSREDLEAVTPRIEAPLSVPYRAARFEVMPGLTAGPTFAHAMARLAEAPRATLDEMRPAHARALLSAYRARLTTMGHDGEVHAAPGSTTHFSVVDRQGNMVAHTQTLLSIFGARVVSPSTGFLLNNGIMWFDPVQGRANSLTPGAPCLMNICPVLGQVNGARVALGAAGGRKIVSAVVQLAAFLADHDMDLATAFATPRIDVSGADRIVADDALPGPVRDALQAVAPTSVVRRSMLPYPFAIPSGVATREGRQTGATEIMAPWADAVTEPAAL
ncbi:gamma-glutamyltransferase 1 Threonine peptidase. MEROPS family T03 [Roseivivax lentus]|uniref:Gamma-glutamyltransferase 1 Threonine peptidase. MEROPS family T03 n=1 Tax=Roseivivax lentus TaxID=633194 RepID=A0A1N7PB57_9RHOB|nr:gamma-glutamyltransferase [Roseivivax lentus]SIT07852.1 gamma-glutamyltransferase 1 Threonine peptidase. MEROPS family T03 [Roseivivax lentus]